MEISTIIDRWRQEGIELNEGVNPSDIQKLELIVGFKFSAPFYEFYQNCNGFKDRDWNEHMFSIFPLKRIKEEYEQGDNTDFIPFCDYLINCHQIGFCKSKDGIYISYTSHLNKFNDKVAESFELALVEILKNTDKIY